MVQSLLKYLAVLGLLFSILPMAWAVLLFVQGVYESFVDTVDYMILGVIVATFANMLSAASVLILRWARYTEKNSSEPLVMIRVFRILSGFWFVVGVLLAIYGLVGALHGLYETAFQGNSERMLGAIMILVVAAVLSICSFLTIRYARFFPAD